MEAMSLYLEQAPKIMEAKGDRATLLDPFFWALNAILVVIMAIRPFLLILLELLVFNIFFWSEVVT